MFEDGDIVNRFIEGWRTTGQQRFGYLLGRYTEFTDVPLGIRVVVSAIYEPPQVWVKQQESLIYLEHNIMRFSPQDSAKYSLELLDDPMDTDVQNLAGLLGLRKVWWSCDGHVMVM